MKFMPYRLCFVYLAWELLEEDFFFFFSFLYIRWTELWFYSKCIMVWLYFVKWNATLLQFLHHFETHTLLFSIRFLHVPCTFTHTLLQPGSHRLYACFIRIQEEQHLKHLRFVVHFIKCSCLRSAEFLSGPTLQKQITWSKTGTTCRTIPLVLDTKSTK